MARADTPTPSSRILVLAGVIVIFAALYMAREVLIPLALATLFAFLLTPLVRWAERIGLPRVPAVLVVVLIVFAVLGLIGWVIVGQVQQITGQLGQYSGNLEAKWQSLHDSAMGLLGKANRTVNELRQGMATTQATQPAAAPAPESQSGMPAGFSFVQGLVGSATSLLTSFAIVLVLVIFMLVQREDLRDRLLRLVGQGQLNATTQAMDDAAGRVSRYLLMQAIVNGSEGLAIGLGLLLIGIPGAALWGLLAALLRFIPYIGIWMAAASPFLLSLAVGQGWAQPALVLALYAAVELTAYNALEPLLYGHSTGVSPIAILVAAIFWAWLWGPVGLVLATPMTVCVVVIGQYVRQLKFLDVLLGDQPVFEPHVRYYQRLIAMDADEAEEMVEEMLKADRPLVDVYDTLILPAMSLAQEGHRHRLLEPDRREFILESIRETLDDLAERYKLGDDLQLSATSAGGEPHCVIIPARDEADELAGIMLCHILRQSDVRAQFISAASLASERVKLVEESRAEVLVISALPPAALPATRYLCKRLRGRMAGLKVVVGLWRAAGDLSRAAERLGCQGETPLVTSLAAARNQLRELAATATAKQPQPVAP